MRRYRITIAGQTFEVEVLDDPRQGQVRVRVDGELFTVGVGPATGTPPAGAPAQAAPGSVPGSGGRDRTTVAAPLPGLVRSVAVHPGQQVRENDPLVVIEAMKMENVVRARRAGVIGSLYVSPGQQVGYGEPLLDFAE